MLIQSTYGIVVVELPSHECQVGNRVPYVCRPVHWKPINNLAGNREVTALTLYLSMHVLTIT